jgi:hypothetical protein
MRSFSGSIVLLLAIAVAAPVAAQPGQGVQPKTLGLGHVNPNAPVFINRPTPGGPFTIVPKDTPGSRETIPFTDEPHRFNNPHPMLPNAGLGYAVRQVWVPPQPVVMQVYVPASSGAPEQSQAQYAEIPGFYVTETTTGYLYPERWTIDQPSPGVYQWRKVPAQFVPR